jgi:hypothetical protein
MNFVDTSMAKAGPLGPAIGIEKILPAASCFHRVPASEIEELSPGRRDI